jgi:hypothetical protein
LWSPRGRAIVMAMTEQNRQTRQTETAEPHADVQEAIDRERLLFRPEIRASADRLEAVLDPEFQEIGASGRLWNRDDMVQALTRGAARERPVPVSDTEMTGRLLAPGVVLLTYVSEVSGRQARRSSIWRRHDDGMRVRHHQGTPLG